MNNLVATWRHSAEVDVDVGVGADADVCELLSRVHDRLAEIPELEQARRLVDRALGEVLAWFDGGVVSLPVRG